MCFKILPFYDQESVLDDAVQKSVNCFKFSNCSI